MYNRIETIFTNTSQVSSDAHQYYKDYWTDGQNISEGTQKKNIEILKYYFPEGLCGKTILEIGVGGEGGLLLPLKGTNIVEGVDVSESAIKNCMKFGIVVQHKNLDCDRLPFPDKYFDVIFAFEVFEHFSNPQFAIEEVYRVLKESGRIIISIPTPFTYHWPRLFYPSLFEKQNFKEFLLINGFDGTLSDFFIFRNMISHSQVPEQDKWWSWFWDCVKIKSDNSEAYFNHGLYFWEQKTSDNIRTKPIEAIEFFRKAYHLSPNNFRIKLTFIQALLYRFFLGDQEEMSGLLNSVNLDLSNPELQCNAEFLYRILLIDKEAKKLTNNGLPTDLVSNVQSILRELPNSQKFLEKLKDV